MHIYNKYRPAQNTRPLTSKIIIRIYALVLIILLITIILATGYVLIKENLELKPKTFKTQAKTEELAALDFYDYFSLQEEINKHQAYLDYIEQNSPLEEEIITSTTTQKATVIREESKFPFTKPIGKSEKVKKYVYNILEVAGKTLRIIHYPLSIFQIKK